MDVTITSFVEAQECYRHRDLRQALYDAGEVIMSDVIVNLHGDEHRARRRLENRLFRRDTFHFYESDLFPRIIEATIAPHVAAGRTELVSFGHQLMMNLGALAAGVDRPLGTPEETFALYEFLTVFIEGATLAHYTGDQAAKAAEVSRALEAFDREFLAPSIERRTAALAAGTSGEADLPRDVLTVLLANTDKIPLSHESLRREIAFYLLAGTHTSATAFNRVMHNIFGWLAEHPADVRRVTEDRLFVQRCMHETIRLQPSSPTGMRWVLEDVALSTGRQLAKGDRVILDLTVINRDTTLFGADAQDFNPNRTLGPDVAPWGLSFGQGMHACIGQDLAAGLRFADGDAIEDHLFGLVPIAVQTMFDHGCRPDPTSPPEMDASTTRPYFGRYPVIFDPALARTPSISADVSGS